MKIAINIVNEAKASIPPRSVKAAVKRVVAALPLVQQSTVTIRFVTDELMQSLNRQFCQENEPTDVLSLPVHSFDQGKPPPGLPAGPVLLGEVVVNLDQAKRQARQAGHDSVREVQSLIEHGARHLIGFHHN